MTLSRFQAVLPIGLSSPQNQMAVKIRIGTKIFALAVFLLCLTVALSIFGAIQAKQLRAELVQVAERDIPLDDALEDLNGDMLRRSVEFERWLGQLNNPMPDEAVIKEASEAHEKYASEARKDIMRASAVLARTTVAERDAEDVGRVRALLDEVQHDLPLLDTMQKNIAEARRTGNKAAEHALMSVRKTLQDDMEARQQALDMRIAALTARASAAAEAREQRLIGVTASVTGVAILFGLAFAWLMTRRMVQPVQVLMSGLQSVERGDLKVELPVGSSDEIGALTHSFNKLVVELRSKERLKETFGKYIDPRIVEDVILNPAVAETGGGRRIMTVSFSDLVGFTDIGENLTPTGLVRLLNRHFSLMAQAVHESDGVLDKFIGDAVMAFWGPPFTSSSEHSVHACRAALAQLELLGSFRADLPELTGLRKNLPTVDLRVGLATGEVVVGNIGSENSRSYTVIGDTVNLASRLEGVNRVYDTRILLNESSRNLAGETIVTREVDFISVKGKTEPVRVYELLGMAGEVELERLTLRDRYEEALVHYRARRFHAARCALKGALELVSEDGPARVLLARVEHWERNPPAEDWDGVWRLREK